MLWFGLAFTRSFAQQSPSAGESRLDRFDAQLHRGRDLALAHAVHGLEDQWFAQVGGEACDLVEDVVGPGFACRDRAGVDERVGVELAGVTGLRARAVTRDRARGVDGDRAQPGAKRSGILEGVDRAYEAHRDLLQQVVDVPQIGRVRNEHGRDPAPVRAPQRIASRGVAGDRAGDQVSIGLLAAHERQDAGADRIRPKTAISSRVRPSWPSPLQSRDPLHPRAPMNKTLSLVFCVFAFSTVASAQLEISIGLRETGFAGGSFPGIGGNGGTSGGIEWIDLDGQTLTPDGTWQQFTFTLASNPVSAFAGGSANGVLDGAFGTLEHVRVRNTGGHAGPLSVWVDDVANTTTSGTTIFGTFEGYSAGAEVMLQQPGFSGSTSGNVLSGSASGIDNTNAHGGSGSQRLDFQFVDASTTRWVRLTTFNTVNQPNPSVRFDQNSVITIWLRATAATGPSITFIDRAPALGWPASNDNTRGMAWADYDGDGDFDVYLQNQGSSSRLLRNDGTIFVDVTASMAASHPTSGWSAAWGDYDNDGRPDLYTGNYTDNNLFRNNYPAAFTDIASSVGCADASFAQGVQWMDHDRDGDLDLYVTQEFDPFRFFSNDGDGTFTDLTAATGLGDPQSHGYGVAWADVDDDGDFDCFVSTCGGVTINRLFVSNLANTGSLLYTESAASYGVDYGPNTYACEFADFDEDGDWDLFVAGAMFEPNHLYENTGSPPWPDIAVAAGVAGPPSNGHGAVLGDFDNDGWVDIYVLDFHPTGANRLYRNLGGMNFVEVPGAGGANPVSSAGYDCTAVDYDNDGDLDIHSAVYGRDHLFENAGNDNHWFQVVPRGTVDNALATGVTVELEAGGRTQRRLVNAAAGAFSQNLLPAHFGLGAATVVDRVTVHWLDGTSDTHLGVPGDRRITIVQSSGTLPLVAFGDGCPTTFGSLPRLDGQGAPTLGNLGFGIELSNSALNAPVLFTWAAGPGATPIDPGNGCLLWGDAASLYLFVTGPTTFGGDFTLPFPLPNIPLLAGVSIAFQALVVDPLGTPLPSDPTFTITTTPGLLVTLGL